jgi:hypothetical protein
MIPRNHTTFKQIDLSAFVLPPSNFSASWRRKKKFPSTWGRVRDGANTELYTRFGCELILRGIGSNTTNFNIK